LEYLLCNGQGLVSEQFFNPNIHFVNVEGPSIQITILNKFSSLRSFLSIVNPPCAPLIDSNMLCFTNCCKILPVYAIGEPIDSETSFKFVLVSINALLAIKIVALIPY